MRDFIFLLLIVFWVIGIFAGFGVHWTLGLVSIFFPPFGVLVGLVGVFL